MKPALTPEEWGGLVVQGEGRNDELFLIAEGWNPWIPEARKVDDLPHHAIAAIALHNQPFGFSRDDVDALRSLAADLHPNSEPFHSLASRIEALLPPVEGP